MSLTARVELHGFPHRFPMTAEGCSIRRPGWDGMRSDRTAKAVGDAHGPNRAYSPNPDVEPILDVATEPRSETLRAG